MGLLGEGVLLQHLFGLQFYRDQLLLNRTDGTEWFWAIGVLVTLCGATLTIVGLLLQKQSHNASSDSDNFGRSGSLVRPYWMQSRWLLGSLVWVIGNLVCWVALGLAPQSILAAINCWNIVITLVIAPWFLGEPVSTRTALSALLLALGTAWVVTFGPKAYQQQTVPLILEAFKKPQSIVAFVVTVAFLMTMSVIGYNRWRSNSRMLSYFQFTAISACFAWYATLLSKSTAKVLVASVQLHQSLYLHPAFWALAAAFPACAVAQVHFLNMGLKNGEAVAVIPMYEALSMTGQIVIGGVVFDEFASLTLHQLAWFWPGVAVVLLGITSLAFEAHSSPEAKLERLDEERIPLLTGKQDVEQNTWH